MAKLKILRCDLLNMSCLSLMLNCELLLKFNKINYIYSQELFDRMICEKRINSPTRKVNQRWQVEATSFAA